MADRELTAASITGLGHQQTHVYHLLRVDFSTKLYYTDAPHDIEHDDGDGLQTYVSSANCPKFPNIKESLGIKPSTLSLDFSGSAANHALTLTEDYKNVPVYIYRAIGNPANTGSPELVSNPNFDTDVSGWSATGATATWNAGSQAADLSSVTSNSKYLHQQFVMAEEGVITYSGKLVEDHPSSVIRQLGIGLGPTLLNKDLGIFASSDGATVSRDLYLEAGTYWLTAFIWDLTHSNIYTFDDLSVTVASQIITVFNGYIDSFETKENQQEGTSSVTWRCASHWANWEAKNGRFINSESQARIGFSSDAFFEFAGVTDGIMDYWGGMEGFAGITSNQLYNFNLTTGLLDNSGVPAWYQDSYDFRTLEGNFYNWEKRTVSALKLPVAYGNVVTKGTPVFRAVTGTNNEYLWVVYALSEGICHSLTGDKIQIDEVAFDDAQFDSKIKYAFYKGSDTQLESDAEDQGSGSVCDASDLRTASPEWDASNRDGRGITYCIMRYEFDKTIFNSVPEPLFFLKGRILADPNGGADAHSTNPAWVGYDYLSNTRYGKGIPVADLIEFDSGSTYAATTNYDYGSGSLISLFDFNGMVDTGNSLKKNAESILFCMRGYIAWAGGKYKLVIERHTGETSAYSFTEDNLADEFSVKESGIKSLLNLVEYEFVDPLMGYSVDVVYEDSATYLSEDNGRELRVKFTNKFETNRYRAKNRALTILKHSRENISGSLSASSADALQIECGDIIDVTRTTQGWTNKEFRVHGMTVRSNGDIVIDDYREYTPTAFNWAVGSEVTLPADTTLVTPFTVSAPTGVTQATGTTRTAADGSTFHRLKVTWTASVDAYVTHYEVQVKESNDGSTEWVQLPNIDAGGDTFVHYEPVPVGIDFDSRVRAVNSLGRYSAWVTDSSYTITGDFVLGAAANMRSTDNINGDNYFFHTIFESLDNYSVDTNVTKGANSNGFLITSVGQSFVYKWMYYDISGILSWSTKRTARAKVYVTNTGTAGDIYIGMGFGSSHITAYFSWNNGTSMFDIKAETTKSTVQALSSTLVSVPSGSVVEISIETDPANNQATITVNGVSATIGSSSTFPTASYNVPMYYFVTGVAGGTLTVIADEYLFLQEG